MACVCHPWLVGWYHEAATDQRGGQFPIAPCVQVLLAPLRLATMPWATRLFPLWWQEEGWGTAPSEGAPGQKEGWRAVGLRSLPGPSPRVRFPIHSCCFLAVGGAAFSLTEQVQCCRRRVGQRGRRLLRAPVRALTLDLPFPGPSGFPAASHGDHWSYSLIALSCRCYRRNHSHIYWGGQGRCRGDCYRERGCTQLHTARRLGASPGQPAGPAGRSHRGSWLQVREALLIKGCRVVGYEEWGETQADGTSGRCP